MQRIALVTGASRGIGKACALALAKSGARVAIAARQRDKLEETATEIRALGAEAYVVEIDMSKPEQIRAGMKKVEVDFGPVLILVNNAAVTRDNLALRMKQEQWHEVIETNLSGPFLACQAVLKGMMGVRWGRIINLSSVVGQSGNAGQANYVAAKAGLIGLTKTLAQEMASRNVTVNAVAPGFIETDMTAVLGQEVRDKILSGIPLKRFGTVDDIAAAVAFLASEQAGYITGQVLGVNGGMYM